ncbi:hypothetical protein BJ878DRAFT_302355 [Calycina marina]|uniref:Acyltransferase 3 domain-containing protein n=1 Tax=Calycina marina TaxID=1763456 RepID=A0A9P7Z6K4_9HELO|nr:hypothetical protein BJ878DRAFT_302355 [Calycina marina]
MGSAHLLRKLSKQLIYQRSRSSSTTMSQVQSKLEKKPSNLARYDHLDNFRSLLTALVIYHHVAIPNGGLGSRILISKFSQPNTSLPLMAFNVVYQTFFMDSFFYLPSYFSAKAMKRKGMHIWHFFFHHSKLV